MNSLFNKVRFFIYSGLFFMLALFSFTSCKNESKEVTLFQSEYEMERWETLKEKYSRLLLLNEKMEWIDEIYHLFMESDRHDELIDYLGELASLEKDPYFTSYLYFIMSNLYWENKEEELAAFYMARVTGEIYGIKYDYQEIGYLIALRTLKLRDHRDLKEKMIHLLLEKYPDQIDEMMILNELAMIYKESLQLKKVISTMERILVLARRTRSIPESINIDEIRNEVKFYYSNKDWVEPDLSLLIDKIKYAIQKRNVKLLASYVSDVDFRIRLFQKPDHINWTFREIAIQRRWDSNIVFSRNLEDFSNENEAFLETKNWNFPQMRTWYFYFKRVQYPYDLSIDGGWEWKGIFFGNWF